MRIAIVSEGVTDTYVIERALDAIIGDEIEFEIVPLQPSRSIAFDPNSGGWGGVYHWCKQFVSSSRQSPIGNLSDFDLVILHVDGDVSNCTYGSAHIQETETDSNLPCITACPPATNTTDALRQVIASWLGRDNHTELPRNWILCIPAMCIETWLIVSIYQDNPILNGIECNLHVGNWLSQRPLNEGPRFISGTKKKLSSYENRAYFAEGQWLFVCNTCTEANRFNNSIRDNLPPH